MVLTHRRVQLALPALARLLVMTVLAEIGEYTRLLAFLLETLQRALKVLVVMDDDFRQNLLPPFLATSIARLGQTCKLRPRTGLGQAKLLTRIADFDRCGSGGDCGVIGTARAAF